ncbi:MAG: glycosyltransferase family 39 protein [Candidatus Hydrogenedentes bacterium]|nr:glycosyltransferase family 39 protein [Candidatus Hydrogenedentota bacterium]
MDDEARTIARKESLYHWTLVVLLMLSALAYRLYGISGESLWHDEATSVLYLHSPTIADYFKTQVEIDPAIVPLYFVIEYYTAWATGHSILALRAVSLAFGMTTLVLLYVFGRRLFGPAGGLLTLLFGAFSKTMLYQSQEIRMYALTFLLALAAMYTFYLAYTERKPLWWVLNIAFNCALFFTHLLALSVVVAQGIAYLLLQRRRVIPVVLWSLAHVPALLLLAMWVSSIDTSAVDRHLGWIQPPGIGHVLGCYLYVFPGTKFSLGDPVRYQLLGIPYLHIVGAAFILACIVFVVRRKNIVLSRENSQAPTYNRPAAILLISWLIVPVVTLLVLSYTVRPCLSERYLGYQAFPMFLMMAGCVTTLKTPTRRMLACTFFILMTVCNVLSFDRPLRIDSASGVAYLESRIAPDDRIVFTGKRCVAPFTYYSKLDPSRFILSMDYEGKVIEEIETGKTVWLIVSRILSPSIRVSAKHIDQLLEGRNYEIERKEFPGFAPLYIYRVKKIS